MNGDTLPRSLEPAEVATRRNLWAAERAVFDYVGDVAHGGPRLSEDI